MLTLGAALKFGKGRATLTKLGGGRLYGVNNDSDDHDGSDYGDDNNKDDYIVDDNY